MWTAAIVHQARLSTRGRWNVAYVYQVLHWLLCSRDESSIPLPIYIKTLWWETYFRETTI